MSIRADGCEDLRAAIVNGELLPGERLLEVGDLIALSNANARLHAAILEASGHDTVNRLSRALSSQIVRFQYRTVLMPGRPDGSLAEHAGIVDAIVARDPDAAEQAMQHHLLHIAEALRMHQNGATAPDEPLAASAAQD